MDEAEKLIEEERDGQGEGEGHSVDQRPCPTCGKPVSFLRMTCVNCGEKIYRTLAHQEKVSQVNTQRGRR